MSLPSTHVYRRLWLLCLLVLLTLGASAQWTDSEQDIPAFHDAAPASNVKLPPILSGKQLTGPNFAYPWQKKVYLQAETCFGEKT